MRNAPIDMESVLEWVRDNPGCTQADIMAGAGRARRAINRIMGDARDLGRVVTRASKASGWPLRYWHESQAADAAAWVPERNSRAARPYKGALRPKIERILGSMPGATAAEVAEAAGEHRAQAARKALTYMAAHKHVIERRAAGGAREMHYWLASQAHLAAAWDPAAARAAEPDAHVVRGREFRPGTTTVEERIIDGRPVKVTIYKQAEPGLAGGGEFSAAGVGRYVAQETAVQRAYAGPGAPQTRSPLPDPCRAKPMPQKVIRRWEDHKAGMEWALRLQESANPAAISPYRRGSES